MIFHASIFNGLSLTRILEHDDALADGVLHHLLLLRQHTHAFRPVVIDHHTQNQLLRFAAALTFVPAYSEIAQAGGERWVAYLLAFQNGFFCPIRFAPRMLREEATFYTLTKVFGG